MSSHANSLMVRGNSPKRRAKPLNTDMSLTFIRECCELDLTHRVPGVSSGTFRIHELAAAFCIPDAARIAVVRSTSKSARHIANRATSDVDFRDNLMNNAPFLAGTPRFSMKAHGIVLAGGAACNALWGERTQYKGDFDFFLVGHADDEDAKHAVLAFLAHLSRVMPGMTVHRTLGCLTVTCDEEPTVQIILRRYDTISEVLHGFDNGACSVAWDGQCAMVSTLGKFSAETRAIIVTLSGRRPTFETRLAKYAARGWDLVFPEMDLSKMVTGDELSHLRFGDWSRTLGAHGIWEAQGYAFPKFPGRKPLAAGPQAEERKSHETPYEQSGMEYSSARKLALRNLRAASEQTPKLEAMCASAPYYAGIDPFRINPVICPADIEVRALEMSNSGLGRLGELAGLLGEASAFNTVVAALRGDDWIVILKARAAERAAELTARCVLPFRFRTVVEDTALMGSLPHDDAAVKAWYGPAHRDA